MGIRSFLPVSRYHGITVDLASLNHHTLHGPGDGGQVDSPGLRRIEPELRAARHGWLAVSREKTLHIAVWGKTEQEARLRFASEIEAWARLRDLPELPLEG